MNVEEFQQTHDIGASMVGCIVEVEHDLVVRIEAFGLDLAEQRDDEVHKGMLVRLPITELECFDLVLGYSDDTSDAVARLVRDELEALAFRSKAVCLATVACEGGLINVDEFETEDGCLLNCLCNLHLMREELDFAEIGADSRSLLIGVAEMHLDPVAKS